MIDDADRVTDADARAHALLEVELRNKRLAESMRVYDPSVVLYCEDCAEAISPERLAAYPLASRCTPCAAACEAHNRSLG